jgi:hypothetical protein
MGARMKFELWKEKEAGFLLPNVWVRVYGLRKELYKFQELWVVGSMLGSTQIVDMETTRKSEFGRILVVVLNPSLILEQMDVVIGEHYLSSNLRLRRWVLMRRERKRRLSGTRRQLRQVGRVLCRMGRWARRRGLRERRRS